MPYNLQSPNGIIEPCVITDLDAWFSKELGQVPGGDERAVLKHVAAKLEAFVQWPKQALLLWAGCNRVPDADKKQKYHMYPDHIRQAAKEAGIALVKSLSTSNRIY